MNMEKSTKEDELKFSLFFLKLYYEKALEILESIISPSLIKIGWTKSLNETYCEFVGEIEKILKMPKFKEFKNEAPYLSQSLSGELTEIDYTWNEYKQNLYSFLNKINKQLIKVNDKSNEMDIFLKGIEETTNQNVQKLIKENHEILKRESEKVVKNIDRANKLKTELNENHNTRSDRIVEWIKKDGILKIQDQDPIEFRGLRGKLVDFFYNQSSERKWLSYDDIRKGIFIIKNAEDIRKAINNINQRITKETKNKYEGIIEVKPEDNQKKEKRYRWKY